MTVAVEQEKEMAEYGQEGKTITPSDYGCQILQEKTTLEAATTSHYQMMPIDLVCCRWCGVH